MWTNLLPLLKNVARILMAIWKVAAPLWSWYQTAKKEGSVRDALEDEIKERLNGVEFDAFILLQELSKALGKSDAKSTKFFQDVLATVVDGDGDLTPVGLAIKEALSDGKIDRKEIALIILAYEAHSGDIELNDLKKTDQVADILGYKRNVNVVQQVERKLNQLIG